MKFKKIFLKNFAKYIDKREKCGKIYNVSRSFEKIEKF